MSNNASPRIVAIANQKGGVGKTTTAINLSACMAALGKRILLVDLDPQGNASTGLGIEPTERAGTTYDLILGEQAYGDLIQSSSAANVDVIPATIDLSSADVDLVSREKRSFLMQDALRTVRGYDLILIDCPPSLNILTVNAFVAAHGVVVPLQSEFFALEGLSQLMLTIRDVRSTANAGLRIDGILLTMHDTRNRLARQVEADARDALGDLVFETTIPRNVRVSEAPSFAQSVLDYDGQSTGSRAYKNLAHEYIDRLTKGAHHGKKH